MKGEAIEDYKEFCGELTLRIRWQLEIQEDLEKRLKNIYGLLHADGGLMDPKPTTNRRVTKFTKKERDLLQRISDNAEV